MVLEIKTRRTPWLSMWMHVALRGQLMAFANIAFHTCGDDIGPRRSTALATRDYMVKGEFMRGMLSVAILAAETIS